MLGIAEPPEWTVWAVCAEGDPDAWFPQPGDPTAYERAVMARRICHEKCPVRLECLEHALAHNETEGIWGGTRPIERKRLLRARRRAAQHPAAAA